MRNIIYIIILVCYYSSNSIAQGSKFKFVLESSIGLSDKIFKPDPAYQLIIDPQILKENELAALSYEFGLLVELELRESISLQMGFKYLNWRERTPKKDLIFDPFGDPSGTTSKFNYLNNYIGIPVRLNYKLGKKLKGTFISFGVIPNFNINNKTKSILISNEERITSKFENNSASYREFNGVLQAGVGFEKMLSSKRQMYIFPNFKIQLFEQVINVPLNRQHFFYGLSIGLKFKS